MEEPTCFDAGALRREFPLLATQVNGRPLAYLDNAATMQAPRCVIEALEDFYRTSNANVHRGVHALSERATERYEAARAAVARFLGASPSEVVLTSGTTDSLNRAADMLAGRLGAGDEVLLTEMEHHSNLLPWRHVAARAGARVVYAPIDGEGGLDERAFCRLLSDRTKIVSMTQLSNVTGIAVPVARLCRAAHSCSPAVCVVDGAQGVAHGAQSMPDLGCDLYAFSGHKLGAPTGTGALFIRSDLIGGLAPARFGGGAVVAVTEEGERLRQTVERFEPGTPNYAGFVGLEAAIRFWEGRPWEGRLRHERALLARLEAGLAKVPQVKVLGRTEKRTGAVSFSVGAGSPFDWCKLLDAQGVAVRSGHHCAQPYHKALGCDASVRVSVAPYNTEEDVDACLAAIGRAAEVLDGSGATMRRRPRAGAR